MIIKNLTSQVLPLKVKELLADCSYDVTIQANGFTEIDRAMEIVQLDSLLRDRKVEIVNGLITPREIVIEDVLVDVPDPVQSQEEEKADTVETPQPVSADESQADDPQVDNVETPQPETSTYICDICGAEFASARGLSSHKKKTHEE